MITGELERLDKADEWAWMNPDEYNAIVAVARGCLRKGWKLQRDGRYGLHLQAYKLGYDLDFTVPHPVWTALTYWITYEHPKLAPVFPRQANSRLAQWIRDAGMPSTRR